MAGFVIVEFCESSEIAVVPEGWLQQEEKFCAWPPLKPARVSKLVKQAVPAEATWNIYEIRVLGKAGTYQRANEKLSDAQFTSDIDTEREESKRRRAPKRKFPVESDSGSSLVESEEDVEEIAVPDPKRYQKSQPRKAKIGLSSAESSTSGIRKESEERYAPDADTFKRLVTAVMEIKHDMRKMGNRIETIISLMREVAGSRSEQVPHHAVLPDDFPLESVEALREWKGKSLQEEEKSNLIAALVNVGGFTIEEFVKRTMKRLITDEVALVTNMSGQKRKEAFGGTQLFDALFAAMKRNPSTANGTEKQLEKVISKWLIGSRDRGGRRAQRLQAAAGQARAGQPAAGH